MAAYAAMMQSMACLQIPVMVASGPYTCNEFVEHHQVTCYGDGGMELVLVISF